MDCLIGYIGLASRIGTAESGLYIDALPDINISNTEKITDVEQNSANDVFDNVQQRSIAKFRTFFTSELNRCFKINKREIVDCLICENKGLLAESLWYLMGAEMMQERLGSNRINRFTTVDRQKSKEQQNSFMETFFTLLSNAVSGIDIHGSDCFQDVSPECRNIIQFVEMTP